MKRIGAAILLLIPVTLAAQQAAKPSLDKPQGSSGQAAAPVAKPKGLSPQAVPIAASHSTRSMTVFSTPNRARHKVAFCTPFSAHWFLFLDSSET